MFQTGSISTLFVLYIHPASNIVLKHITSSMPLMQRHTRPDGGTIPLLGVEACLLPSHTNFKPFFSRTILTLWTVRNKTAAKHYWKHFQLFTRFKRVKWYFKYIRFHHLGHFLVAKWYWSFQMLKINYFPEGHYLIKGIKVEGKEAMHFFLPIQIII